MFRQIEEQALQIERLQFKNTELQAENQRLRRENRSLTQRIETLERTLEERIAACIEQAVEKETKPLYERIAKLESDNERKDAEIVRLKAQINKDSSNSSRPPSSNGHKKIPNNREPSDRKPGGQAGHKGHTLTIPSNLKEMVEEGKAQHVIIDETGGVENYVSDWVIDLQIIPVYTERRRVIGGLPTIQYGRQLQALSVYLQNVGMMSLERVSAFFREATNGMITVSEAANIKFSHTVADHIDLEPYVQELLNAPVLHTDDTPLKTTQRLEDDACEVETAKHTTFNAYMRVYSTSTTTVLTVHAHKDEEGVKRDKILTRFCGILSHDHEAKFYNYGDQHATCCEHLGRELKGMSELNMIPWAEQVRTFFYEMNEQKKADILSGKTCCEPLLLYHYEQWYDELVHTGAEHLSGMKKNTLGHNELRKMVNRLNAFKDSYLLFIKNYTAPFTNNQAERDLRHGKIRQKISGCYRSWQGLLDYCKIRSLTDSSKKRGLSILAAIRSCLPILPSC
jgi:transposase